MTANAPASVDGSARRPADVVVLLCRHAAGAVRSVAAAGLEAALALTGSVVCVRAVDDLCDRPSQIPVAVKSIVGGSGERRLVLGVCENRLTDAHAQVYARRAGFDPFALQVVELGQTRSDGFGDAVPSFAARLRAACARAAAYPGALPENYRAVLADSGAVSRRDFLTLSPVRYRVAPTIDRQVCTAPDGCDLCYAVCATKAVVREGSGFGINRAACTSCGKCLEVCPEIAVQFPGTSPGEISAELTSHLKEGRGHRVAVAFVCREVVSIRLSDWIPVRVTCVNNLPVAVMLQTLADGARAVALVNCRPPCGGVQEDRAAAKVDFCRALLQAFGDLGERVVLLEPNNPATPPAPPNAEILHEGPPNAAFATHGKAAAGEAVQKLASLLGAREATFEHYESPLGVASIDSRACTICETCTVACPTGALLREVKSDSVAITFDPNLCSGCGRCAAACPERGAGAIQVTRAVDVVALRNGRRLSAEGIAVSCANCGARLGSTRLLDRIRVLLGASHVDSPINRLCSSCRAMLWTLQ